MRATIVAAATTATTVATTTVATTDGLALRAFKNVVAPATGDRACSKIANYAGASFATFFLSLVENRFLSFALSLANSLLPDLRLDRAEHNWPSSRWPMSSSVTACGTAPHSALAPSPPPLYPKPTKQAMLFDVPLAPIRAVPPAIERSH